MLREQIKKDIEEQVSRLVGQWDGLLRSEASGVEVVRTNDPRFGDYASNVALKLATGNKKQETRNGQKSSKSYQSPLEIAKILADSLKSLPYVSKLEVAGPGFLNFFIKPGVWQKEVEEVLEKREVSLGNLSGKKIIVEFTDPNPFKEFHIGHLYSNIVGEAICRLLEANGAVVKRVNYQGDVGMHVAKAVWGMRKTLKAQSRTLKDLEKQSPKEKVAFLGLAYTEGARAYETVEKAKEEINALNKQIYEKEDEIDEYRLGKKWSLGHFEEIYRRLGTKFDFYYFESQVGQIGVRLVKAHLGKVFLESEGAVIFPGEKFGLHNRVFINSQGLPTYEAKELGLAPTKYKDFAYDLAIIVTGNEINEYFKVLICALGQVAPDLAKKTRHISHGMVRMLASPAGRPGGKISSRLGNVLLGEELLDEAVKRVKGQFSELSDEIAEQIGTGAVKYALLKGNIGKDVNFSFEESINLNGNSGPYLQYTHARCRSVLAKAGKFGGQVNISNLTSEEDLLLRALGHFEEVVLDGAGAFAPNLIANFLYEVAQKFNTLYNNLPILKAEQKERARRLFLTQATSDILKKGLYLLGISAPEKM